jgi:Lhr-like helicase
MLGQAAALNLCRNWFEDQGWKPFSFQIQAWSAALKGDSVW